MAVMVPRKIVLLVEDDTDDAQLSLLMFQQHGFPHKVVVVCDGVEALEYLTSTGVHAGRDPAEKPALVLLDLNMPRLSGFEVLERIRANPALKDVPVAIYSSSQDSRDKSRARELAAKAYLCKPTPQESGEFVRRVEGLLADGPV